MLGMLMEIGGTTSLGLERFGVFYFVGLFRGQAAKMFNIKIK